MSNQNTWYLDMESRTATVREQGTDRAVARCYQGDDEGHLIAHTIDMLKALKKIEGTLSADPNGSSLALQHMVKNAKDEARAVLAKIEGQSNE